MHSASDGPEKLSPEHKADIAPEASSQPLIAVAGASGDLGSRICTRLIARGARVKALLRPESAPAKRQALEALGAAVVEVDYKQAAALTQALSGCACVVSAFSGLREVIVALQTRLLDAALEAGVPRIIPSDYCIDYTSLRPGQNRNLDLRREFQARLDQRPIRATSILNGMFADLLKGPAPLVQPKLRRVIYWGDPDQPLDFTTIDNTADYTAAAALDPDTPRWLRIAGETLSPRQLAAAASEAMGREFGIFRAGGLGSLDLMIGLTRTLAPQPGEVFPPWQGMMYLRDMLSGQGKLEPLDTTRYPGMLWTPVRDVLADQA